MRLLNLLIGDLKFYFKYKIIYIYLIFTFIYIASISLLPDSAKDITKIILIYTDPTAMGLFFMGAIVMLERSQNITQSLATCPIKSSEYVLSKGISLGLIGFLTGIVIMFASPINNILTNLLGLLLSSIMFSFLGLIVGIKSKTLNQFMIYAVPFEIIVFLPSLLFLFDVINSPLLIIHPGVAAIVLLNNEVSYIIPSIISLIVWNIIIFYITKRIVKKAFNTIFVGAK